MSKQVSFLVNRYKPTMKTQTFEITADQIKNLFLNPVTLVPGKDGYIMQLLNFSAYYKFGTTNFFPPVDASQIAAFYIGYEDLSGFFYVDLASLITLDYDLCQGQTSLQFYTDTNIGIYTEKYLNKGLQLKSDYDYTSTLGDGVFYLTITWQEIKIPSTNKISAAEEQPAP